MAMLKEYFKLSNQYRSEYGVKTLLLFQVGAFFEVYTKVDKKTREITEEQVIDFKQFAGLESANKNDETLMLGFRDYMLDKYIKKVQEAGYTGVVYVQDTGGSNPTRSKLGVFSPGTLFSVDSGEITNNTSCIWIHQTRKTVLNKEGNIIIGMSNIDIYTGKTTLFELCVENMHNPTTYDELERYICTYNPSEIILISNVGEEKIRDIMNYANINSKAIHIVNSEDEHNKLIKNIEKQSYQTTLLKEYYNNNIAETILYSTNSYVFGLQSFIYLLDFMYKHNPSLISKIKEPILENNSERLVLANHSLKQLNIIDDHNYKGKYSSVSKFLNNCITSMGIRKFQYNILNPIFNKEILNREYDITEYLLTRENTNIWRNNLKNIKDIEKLHRQIFLKKITPQSLFQFYENLFILKKLYIHDNSDDTLSVYLHHFIDKTINIDTACETFIELLEKSFIMEECKNISTFDYDVNFVKTGISQELDNCVKMHIESKSKLESMRKYLDTLIAKGEKNTKNDFVKIHETDKMGFTLVCTSRRGKLLTSQITKEMGKSSDASESSINLLYDTIENTSETFAFDRKISVNTTTGQNMSITNPLISETCANIVKYRTKMRDEITQIYNKFINSLQEYGKEFENIVNYVSTVDILQNKCYIAKKYKYCKPTICEDGVNKDKSYVNAKGIRHCLIEHLNTNEIYVTNDLELGRGGGRGKTENEYHDSSNIDGVLLYGTNAVGKTSIIRALGISVIMAQAGLYVPCKSFVYNPYKSLFTRILGNDNIFKGLSTFAVEMSELRIILKMADKNSLILGDELCSGTEQSSAISIFVSGIQKMHEEKSSFIFATHLHEIVDYEEIKNMERLSLKHMTVIYNKELDTLIYDRKLKDGPGESMYGLEVCKSLHLPNDFLENAYSLRRKYEGKYDGILNKNTSHFNAKKIVYMCEVCNINIGTEVHHLLHQESADENNMIDHIHKNHAANLYTVCETCHDNMHKNNIQHIKVKTTEGYILQEVNKK